MSLNFYVIDTETTGLRSKHHEINEISIIRCSDRVQLTRHIKCEYPERSNFDALAITKKTLDDLSKGEDKNHVVDMCNNFFNEDGLEENARCIIGHNVDFDRRFLHALWESCGKKFPANLFLDTISLTKEFLKKTDQSQLKIVKTATGRVSTQLHACCDMLGIKKLSEAHASKVDSRNTYLLWKNLVEDKNIDYLPFIKTAIHTVDQPTTVTDEDGLDPALLDL